MCTILSVIFHLEVSWFRSRKNEVTVYCCIVGIRFQIIDLNLVCENALVFRYLNRQLIPSSKALLKNLKVTNSDKKRKSLLCCSS